LTNTLHENTGAPPPVRRSGPPRLQDVAVSEGAHRKCVEAARVGACPRCITIVDAIIDRGRAAAKQRRLLAS
jgi:hypothetical protein